MWFFGVVCYRDEDQMIMGTWWLIESSLTEMAQ